MISEIKNIGIDLPEIRSITDPTAFRSIIINQINKISGLIQETEEWKRFKQAEYKIEHHGDAQALLFVVRAKRNQYSQVSLRHGYEHPKSIQAKQEYDDILERMANIPLIEEYQAYQEELNELVQGILATVMSSLSATIPVERGEDIGKTSSGGSCGSGGGCGSCKTH
ncbi:YlbF family regulator [Fodinisporobacter ferrooxydans]|uniref:YlbF family regulator n=1 Tax=Fodinisporobacter ferrooxydans TaxID=2901836 RepID=A0ABY4CMU6_9BACL|nr:YlbF family regulator [Alicyclobacillaceae bacterium MYW30-H2]